MELGLVIFMHSGRRPRPRGGKSAKRKKLRESFWNAVNPAAEVDNSVLGGLADPEEEEEEIVEVVNEPVARQQAKAKALRLKSNPNLLFHHRQSWVQLKTRAFLRDHKFSLQRSLHHRIRLWVHLQA